MERGLLLVFTGNAEDNAISAVGQVLRALGAGLKTCVVQFHHGSQQYKELALLQRFFDTMETHGIEADHTSEAHDEPRDLWRKAVEILKSPTSAMVVLLEPSYLLDHNIIDESELLDAIRNRPAPLHVVVAGGRQLDSLIQEADLVTEIYEVKNALRKASADHFNASALPDPA
jgi:cob(I)alamin adenosyltransferase